MQRGNGARSTQDHFPHSCRLWALARGRVCRSGCHCLIESWRRSDIKPVKQVIPTPAHSHLLVPSPSLPLRSSPLLACPPTYTKHLAYIAMPPKIKVCPTLVPALSFPLNALVCLQSERPIRNGPYKPTQIVFHQSGKKKQGMSSERYLLSMRPLCYVAHPRSALGQ